MHLYLYQSNLYREAAPSLQGGVLKTCVGPQGPGWLIETFGVPRDMEGAGFGTKQYQQWEATALDYVERLYVEPVATAHDFWHKMGFVPAYQSEDDWDEGDPADMLWVKELDGSTAVPAPFDFEEHEEFEWSQKSIER